MKFMKFMFYLIMLISIPTWAMHYKAAVPIQPSVTTKTIVVYLPITKNNDQDTANMMDKCDSICHKKNWKSTSSRRMGRNHVECHCAN